MKEGRKPFDRFRYKVCPVIKYCPSYERYGGDTCIYCKLDPRTTSLAAIKIQLKSLAAEFKFTFKIASLRFPRISYFIKFILLPFLLGMVFMFIIKVTAALITG